MTSPLPCVYVALMFTLFVAAIVFAIRARRRICVYWRFGALLAVILLLIDAAVLLVVPAVVERVSIVSLLCIDSMAALRMFVFTVVGMHCCRRLGWPDLPWLRRRLRRPRGTRLGPGLWRGLLVGAAACGYSAVLFALTRPRISDILRSAFGMNLAADETAWGATLLLVLEFAYAEEIAFRLGIQSMLALGLRKNPRGDWIAIVVTTLIWTIAHSQTLDPAWVKLVQVLPVGLALGWLQRRYGLESAMLAHASFNVAGAALLQPLLDLS